MAGKRKPNRNGKRHPINVTLTPDALQKGEKLATEDMRHFSHELEWLIEQEFKRRFPAAQEAA